MIPRAEGGTHDVNQMICLCEAHHLALHEGRLVISGEAPDFTFTRYGHDRFETENRIVETRKALGALGFKRHEVSQAIERTRTHVGKASLTIEQWIRTALGYCPTPLIT